MQDDDIDSTSSTHYFNKADKGRKEKVFAKLREKGKEGSATPLDKRKQELKLKVLEHEIDESAKTDPKKQQKLEQEKAARRSFGPKTLSQKEKEKIQDAKTNPNQDLVVEGAVQAQEAKVILKKEQETGTDEQG